LVAGCAQRTITRIESLQAPCPRVLSNENDTLNYVVAFNDTNEREAFVSSFNQFLKKYPFVNMMKDTVRNYVRIDLLPPSEQLPLEQPITRIEQTQIIEDKIEEIIEEVSSDSTPAVTDSILPDFGGVVRIYFPRKNVDPLFSRLFNFFPFNLNKDTDLTSLIISDSSAHRITLKINGRFTNAENRTLTALDFIDNWTSILKKYPAEGYFLFRNVVGVPEFISGNEATVKGFNALDENTITLRLATNDTLAGFRLRNRRLIDGNLKLGLYHISRRSDNTLELLANSNSGPEKPFLEKIVLCTGGDPNPILSFSLNKYDAVVLTSTNDLEYARRNLTKNASLQEIPGERYFLACASEDEGFRAFIKKQINKSDMLRNIAKAEGTTINSVVMDNLESDTQELSISTGQFSSNSTFKLIYCKDDQISKNIAEKLLATLSHSKISVNLAALEELEYQRCLITRNYDCAVGWVPQNITHNISEQLRLASIWFNDETDALKRLQDNIEIPLFSVKRYLLKRNDLHLYRNSIQGLFRKIEQGQIQPVNEN
jgi:hypothetical protein